MNIIIIIATLVIIALGVVQNKVLINKKQNETESPKVLAETSSPIPTSSPSPTPQMPTLTPTSIPTQSPPLPTPQVADDFLKSFIYPKGDIISQTSNKVVEKSPDMPGTVQKWYEDRINGKGFNKIHWNIQNHNTDSNYTLDCEQNGKSIRISITRNASDSQTNISIGY